MWLVLFSTLLGLTRQSSGPAEGRPLTLSVRSQIVKPLNLVRQLKEWGVMWRPKHVALASHFGKLKALPFLVYEGRRINGNGNVWRSFHFRVIGTDWIAILHDQGPQTKPWVIFARRPPGYMSASAFSNFEKFLSQIPDALQPNFRSNVHLFQPPAPPT